MTTNDPLPIGTRVALLAETMGDDVTGTIAGHSVYAHPETGAPQYGYAIKLDRPERLERDDLAPARRPYITHMLAHVDSVTSIDLAELRRIMGELDRENDDRRRADLIDAAIDLADRDPECRYEWRMYR